MKLGIVNDLPVAVEALRRAMALEPRYEILWVAHDGVEAVALCAQQTPDVVLMDLIMPGMSGVEATRRIMMETPCAILIVTVNIGLNATGVFEAMGCGTMDAADTPSFDSKHSSAGATTLLAKLDSIGKRIAAANDTIRAAKVVYEMMPAARRERAGRDRCIRGRPCGVGEGAIRFAQGFSSRHRHRAACGCKVCGRHGRMVESALGSCGAGCARGRAPGNEQRAPGRY